MLLLVACIGIGARSIFVGDKGVHKLLHFNGHRLDKTFAYAIILLSKVLGSYKWPCGVFGTWPPSSSSTAHSLVLVTDNVEPRLRASMPASSGGSA